MLAYTFYENDGRVMRYAEALAQDGAEVEAIVLRRPGQPVEEVVNGVRLLRIQAREKNESGKFSYLSRILAFFVRSMVEVSRRHLNAPYDLIHVHSVPDFEVFATFVAKLRGAKVILDIHDIVPEFYAAKFKVSQNSLVFKALKWVERLSASFADHVIIANDIWLEKLTSRSVKKDKCSAFINYPDISVFKPSLRTRDSDGKLIMLYPGTLNWHQGLDIAVKAFALAKDGAPGLEFHIYGEGSAKPELQRLVDTLQLGDRVFLNAPRPLREIAAIMANADMGVVPKRDDSFGGEAFSTKILEFMALGVPVIVADTRIDKHYFDDSLVRFFKAGDEESLASALLDTYKDRERSCRLAAHALEFARRNSWNEKKGEYLGIVKRLVDGQA
jgi:glycosyltransferase involved in cell wall biosynthesis